MMREGQVKPQPNVERVPNDGEPPVFAMPPSQGERGPAVTVETKLHDRLRGLFAVADGEPSTAGGYAASLTVASELERQLGASLDTKLENLARSRVSEERRRALMEQLAEQSIELACMEAHRRLFEANQQNPRLRLRAHAAVARMVDVGSEDKTVFFAANGKERLYLVRDGMVSYVGDSTAAMVESGPFGADTPLTVVYKESLEPGDRLVMLGDGAAAVLKGPDLEEATRRFSDSSDVERTLQAFAKAKLEDPRNPDAKAGDVSVISWEAFPMEKPKPKLEQAAESASARRETLRKRIEKAALSIESNRLLSKPDASGRQLLGAEEALVQLEAEKAAAELALATLDIPPRFKKGDRVTLATGATYELKDEQDGMYYLWDARAGNTLVRSRWDIDAAVGADALAVRSGDRIRVERFTSNPKDDWHVMDVTQPGDRFLFEDAKGDHHMAVPAHLTRRALLDMLMKGSELQNRTFALKRRAEKARKGK